MKNKIKEALKTKYANLGLNDKVLDGVADLLSKTATAETDVDTLISTPEILDYLKGIQSEMDKFRQEIAELKKKPAPAPPKTEPPAPAEPPAPDPANPPQPFKLEDLRAMFQDVVAPFAQKFEQLEKKEKSESLLNQAKIKRDTLNLDSKHSTWINDAWTQATQSVSETDTADTIVDRFKTRYDEYMSRMGVSGYVPVKNGGGGGGKTETQTLIDSIMESRDTKSQTQGIQERLGIATEQK